MKFKAAPLKGVFVIDIDRNEDERGFFARAWCQQEFQDHGINADFVQANLALSKKRGTLRGMHLQLPPYAEGKLVRCIQGAVFDAIIDLRIDSPTYKQWFGLELSSENGKALFVPERFAHGYQSLVDNTMTFYHVTQFYAPEFESGIRWDDPAFGIQWPVTENPVVSEKDRHWPDFTA